MTILQHSSTIDIDETWLPPGLAGWDQGVVNYNQLMINAPVISSRYLGTFTGSIISDYILFRLGDLSFAFDSVFAGIVPFPRLQTIKSQRNGQPRVIFDAGPCTGASTDAWECNPNVLQ